MAQVKEALKSYVDMPELLDYMKKSNIELIFSGAFSQGLIEELGEAVRERLKKQKIEKNKISATLMAFIEQTQNIKNYLISIEDNPAYFKMEKTGIIVITSTETGYCIQSGNAILNEHVDPLRERLQRILLLDREGHNKLFRELSKQDINLETGQAGLGLVQVARKVDKPLEYYFQMIDDEISFYNLMVRI